MPQDPPYSSAIVGDGTYSSSEKLLPGASTCIVAQIIVPHREASVIMDDSSRDLESRSSGSDAIGPFPPSQLHEPIVSLLLDSKSLREVI